MQRYLNDDIKTLPRSGRGRVFLSRIIAALREDYRILDMEIWLMETPTLEDTSSCGTVGCIAGIGAWLHNDTHDRQMINSISQGIYKGQPGRLLALKDRSVGRWASGMLTEMGAFRVHPLFSLLSWPSEYVERYMEADQKGKADVVIDVMEKWIEDPDNFESWLRQRGTLLA